MASIPDGEISLVWGVELSWAAAFAFLKTNFPASIGGDSPARYLERYVEDGEGDRIAELTGLALRECKTRQSYILGRELLDTLGIFAGGVDGDYGYSPVQNDNVPQTLASTSKLLAPLGPLRLWLGTTVWG